MNTGNKYRKKKRFQFKKNYIKMIERRIIRRLLFLSRNDPDDYLPWIASLKKTDKFLVKSDNLNDSFLNRSLYVNETNMPLAYMNAAIILLTMIQYTNSNCIKDGLIYPALFSFRHFLELSMKDSIKQYRGGEPADCAINREHNLMVIWNEFQSYINKSEDKEIMEKLINEVNMIDPTSEIFRYPYIINTEGNLSMPDVKQTRLNDIKSLKTIMLKMYRFLDGENSLSYVK